MPDSNVVVLFGLLNTLVDMANQPMPGVKELVEALYEAGALLGVVSGIEIDVAGDGLADAGLKERFSVFVGPETSDRQWERLSTAVLMAEGVLKAKTGAEQDVHASAFYIDNRPDRALDAEAAGIRFIGVTTGMVPYEGSASPLSAVHAVFKDLRDTKAVLAAITGTNKIQQKGEKSRSKS